MTDEHTQAEGHAHELDADAVCAQCGTVTPEGTFICKVCGNNLRDQRAMRLTADQAMDGEAPTSHRRQWLLGTLTIVGLIVISLAATNTDSITNWLIGSGDSTMTYAQALWSGPYSETLNEIALDLDQNWPTEEAIVAGQSTPDLSAEFDGRYVLVWAGETAGVAQVEVKEQYVYFVARIYSEVEIRGRGRLQEASIIVDWENGGAKANNEYFWLSGAAAPNGDGTIDCFGFHENSDDSFQFIAYKLTAE
jgi:hypothetical protein